MHKEVKYVGEECLCVRLPCLLLHHWLLLNVVARLTIDDDIVSDVGSDRFHGCIVVRSRGEALGASAT